ncbi:MAG: GNAT family N-acetyltransferase [Xanthomonadaceae bacterium]|nr:GNAT family N-acetyltransferase [Xanthomonadaceae bacterium]
MHNAIALALAKHKDETLTVDVARAILRDCDAGDRSINPYDFAPEQFGAYRIWCERLRTARSELKTHREAYLAERHPDRPQDIDWFRLLSMSYGGQQVVFTARDEAGKLVGSMWLFVGKSINTGELAASDDLFYIEPAHRGGMLAARMWRYAEQAMFRHGVREASFLSRADTRAERLARFMGYTPEAIRVTKTCYSGVPADMPMRHKEK